MEDSKYGILMPVGRAEQNIRGFLGQLGEDEIFLTVFNRYIDPGTAISVLYQDDPVD
jgi:hypothetical protein